MEILGSDWLVQGGTIGLENIQGGSIGFEKIQGGSVDLNIYWVGVRGGDRMVGSLARNQNW